LHLVVDLVVASPDQNLLVCGPYLPVLILCTSLPQSCPPLLMTLGLSFLLSSSNLSTPHHRSQHHMLPWICWRFTVTPFSCERFTHLEHPSSSVTATQLAHLSCYLFHLRPSYSLSLTLSLTFIDTVNMPAGERPCKRVLVRWSGMYSAPLDM
jgi:hypothetical protein